MSDGAIYRGGVRYQRIRQTQTTPVLDENPKAIDVPCLHPDDAVPVAKYIVEEIKQNTPSDIVKGMKELNSYDFRKEIEEWSRRPWYQRILIQPQDRTLESSAAALALWTIKVRTDGPWDHKPKIALRFPTRFTRRFYHKYLQFEYFYDVWSNIHYGYVGMAAGFSESQLLDGAGLEQIGTDLVKRRMPKKHSQGSGMRTYDNVADQVTIRIGIELYFELPYQKISAQHVLDKLSSVSNWGEGDETKLPHVC